MRRLYLQIYLTVVAVLLLFGLLASATWFVFSGGPEEREMFAGFAAVVNEVLPSADRPASEVQATLERLAPRLSASLAVWSKEGMVVASVGGPLPAPNRNESGWIRARGRGAAMALHLPDGRWLVARHVHGHRALGWLAALALLAVAVAVGSYPIVRRITRRLERLQSRVDKLGAGDLAARVEVEGNDEVAELARRFNQAAARIERLVTAQRSMLAGVSHELRTPLARMRVAIELLSDNAQPELRDRVAKDIADLDELIAELLLASRLDFAGRLERSEEVDLLAVVAEEASRSDVTVRGEPVRIQGDRRMLRRLVRNLIDNARKHGGGSPVEAEVASLGVGGGARLRVLDRGPGVPESEREQIFEPFYRTAGARERADGVGLGLALVRQIARHHGGDASCRAREGGGSCFEVELNAWRANV
jgi:signal transduction histidine kinase